MKSHTIWAHCALFHWLIIYASFKYIFSSLIKTLPFCEPLGLFAKLGDRTQVSGQYLRLLGIVLATRQKTLRRLLSKNQSSSIYFITNMYILFKFFMNFFDNFWIFGFFLILWSTWWLGYHITVFKILIVDPFFHQKII